MCKPILDVCCGSRMFYFDKNNPDVVFMDCRKLEEKLCDGRKLEIKPDIIGDFRNIPFIRAGDKSWLALKYGKLSSNWKEDLTQGFNECMRVLRKHGTLVFKWNEEQIALKEILSIFPQQPVLGNKRSKTHWLVFMKM